MYYFYLSIQCFQGAMQAAGPLAAAWRRPHSARLGQAVRRMH